MGRKGQVPWNKDRTGVYSEETRQSMGAKNIGRIAPNKGIPMSKEQRKKMEPVWEKNRNYNHTDESIEKIRIARLHQVFPPKDNEWETWWQQRFAYDGFDFEKHKPIVGQPDIVIDKFCIFLDGDRHHANPSKYSDDTIIWKASISKSGKHIPAVTAKMIRERDEEKRQKLIADGYEIIPVWWSDWKKDPEKCFQKIIKIIKEAKRI